MIGWIRRHRGTTVLMLVVLAGVVLAAGAAVAIASGRFYESTNTYPVDVFMEMHYQKSFETYEPPRFAAPDGIVPIEGRAPLYSQQEAAGLENPLPASQEVVQRGQDIFIQNCIMCHGSEARGDGVMASYFINAGRPPANLAQQRLIDAPDGYIYSVVVNGLGEFMPPFGNLIPGDDIWALVHYIRTLQQP